VIWALLILACASKRLEGGVQGFTMDRIDTKTLDRAIEYIEQRLTTVLGLP
jgi:hypothetical protein